MSCCHWHVNTTFETILSNHQQLVSCRHSNGLSQLPYSWKHGGEGYLSINHQSQIFTANLCRSSAQIVMWEGLEGRIWRALELFIHSVAKTLLPSGKLLAPHYCSTWPRVSGSLRARKLPAASAPEAKRMGTALVIPTNEVKMLIPKTAANLQRALRKPNAVVLRKDRGQIKSTASGSVSQRRKALE